MSSPDPEPFFFRAWSLRPKLHRNRSSETEISPKATPTAFKTSQKAKRPDHVRLKSDHFLDRIGLRDRVDRSRTASEEDHIFQQHVQSIHSSPETTAVSPDSMPIPAREERCDQVRSIEMRSLVETTRSPRPQKNGLSWGTKFRLSAQRKQVSPKPPGLAISPPRSFTGQLLDRAATVLRHLPEKDLTSASSHSSGHSINGSSAHRSYLSPLRRIHSNASSLRTMLMGDGPLGTPTTPDPHVMYIGSDQKQYFRVEISSPGAPTYLPSEARRIGTPPMLEQSGRPGEFFFGYDAPDTEDKALSPTSHPMTRKGVVTGLDWSSARLQAVEARNHAMDFELNVPEHLPSSPLCPKHPKHKSGGKGICVYHGRNRDEGEEQSDMYTA